MSLTEEEQLTRIAEALLIERMDLSPEKRITLAVLLENLRWFKMVCEKESKSFDQITPEFLIQRFTGLDVRAEELLALTQEIKEQMNDVESTRSLLETLQVRSGHTKPHGD